MGVQNAPPIDEAKLAELHRGIGQCITIWSLIESLLLELLVYLIDPREVTQKHALSGAFYSALAFDQKLKMVNAAAQFSMPKEFLGEWQALHTKLTRGATTRNHIAHFQIHWAPRTKISTSFALSLRPSIMNSSASAKNKKTSYAQHDLNYISNNFHTLAQDLMTLNPKISPRSPAK